MREGNLIDYEGAVDPELFALLPAWFVPEMTTQNRPFGLLLTNGTILAIRRIDDVAKAADGTIWLDVIMADRQDIRNNYAVDYLCGTMQQTVLHSPPAGIMASVNAAHVMAAFELSEEK